MESNDKLSTFISGAAAKEQLYAVLVQSVRDYAIIVINPKGIIVSWNEGARRIKGYEAGEIIGQHFSVFYPECDRPSKPAYELKIAEAEGRFEDEGWRLRKDGSSFWANVIVTTLRDSSGDLLGFA